MRNRAALYYWQSAVQGAGYTITRPFPFGTSGDAPKTKRAACMFGSPLGPAGSGGLVDKEPAVDDQLNPSGFVPFSKRDRRGSGVGSRRPPTGSPNHPWRSCSASRRNTTLGNLISLGQCGLNAKTAAISETCRLYFACVLRLAPSIKPHTAVSSGYRVGLHFAGLAGGAVAMRQCCRGI